MSLEMKYFVLKPKGDDVYALASRKAMVEYSKTLRTYSISNKEASKLADELEAWSNQEQVDSDNRFIDKRWESK
jgi:hypothetical protein